ncbi:unnamed protein product [Ectocarpus fasciculatus]
MFISIGIFSGGWFDVLARCRHLNVCRLHISGLGCSSAGGGGMKRSCRQMVFATLGSAVGRSDWLPFGAGSWCAPWIFAICSYRSWRRHRMEHLHTNWNGSQMENTSFPGGYSRVGYQYRVRDGGIGGTG